MHSGRTTIFVTQTHTNGNYQIGINKARSLPCYFGCGEIVATETILKIVEGRDGRVAAVPVGREGEEALRPLVGQHAKVKLVGQGRNVKRLRLFFALMNVVHPHQDMYPTVDILRKAVLCAIGFYETIKLPGGREILAANSISFAEMDEPDFIIVLERSIEFIYTRIIPGVTSDDLMKQVNEILEGR